MMPDAGLVDTVVCAMAAVAEEGLIMAKVSSGAWGPA